MGEIQLSNREIAILHMVAQGADNTAIAYALKTSKESVEVYICNVRKKLGLHNRRAMMALSPEEIEGYRKPAKGTLTQRENEVAVLVAQGLSNEQIGGKLHPKIKAFSVDKHIQNMFEKLGITSRVKLAIYAVKAGLVQLDDIEL
jgi:DNA-binding NarL/FixJ family response regulator